MKTSYFQKNGNYGNVYMARNGRFECNFLNSKLVQHVNNNNNDVITQCILLLYRSCKNTKRNTRLSADARFKRLENLINKIDVESKSILNGESVYRDGWKLMNEEYEYVIFEEPSTAPVKKSTVNIEAIVQKFIDFFSEFSFEPNFRFMNTLCHTTNPKEYVTNYFTLSNNAFLNAIKEKMKSDEFRMMLNEIKNISPSTVINKHFKIYYGSQGTGKTTKAMEEANNNCMVCHSAMLPQDMLEDFDFDNGNATFKPSALYKAIEEGKTIVLDEINLLPFESVRFLQSILDGKKCFTYKGKEVNIHDNFKVVGTMNLTVNGGVYALPEPLIDRAMELSEFKLTADMLRSALE